MADTVFLIDTFSLMFQVFHGLPPMTSPAGMPTNAVFGFSRDLVSILQTHRPTWLICALESTTPGEREKIYPEYKANRSEMPEDLRPQIALIKEVIEAFRIPCLHCDGWEADDVIATLTKQAVARGANVNIVTSDKDARQLLGPQVKMLNLRKNTYLDEAGLLADWGIRPDQVVDFQSLVGDAVDNVPGVPLVGPKKAQALLNQYHTLEGVLANADQAPGAKLKQNLKDFAHQAELSRRLVRLQQDLDVPFDWDANRTPQPDVPALQALFRRFGFRKLIDDVRQFGSGDASLFAADPAKDSSSRKGKSGKTSRSAGRGLFDEDVGDVASPVSSTSTETSNPDDDSPEARLMREAAAFVRPSSSTASDSSRKQSARQAKTGDEQSADAASSTKLTSKPDRTWSVIDTPEALASFVARLAEQPRFCLDLETTGLDPRMCDIVGWAFCWQVGEAWYLPVRGPLGSQLLNGKEVVNLLRPVLENPSLRLVNQNIKFDLMVLEAAGIRVVPEAIDVDPMVGDYLLDAGARSHGLDTLMLTYLGVSGIPISDLIGTGKSQKNMADVPVDLVAEYATEDADYTFRLADLIGQRLKDQGLWDLYWDLERPLIPLLAEMEQTGIRVDADELRRQSADLAVRLEQIEAEIYRLAGHRFNIDSPKQLQVVLFDELDLPAKKKTKTGASTDQEVLEDLATLHALPAEIIKHRHLQKLKGTYLDALPGLINQRTGRIHTSFNQVVAATGRLSSSEPNLQNIPIRTPEGERIRRAFTASPLAVAATASGSDSANVTADTEEWQLVCADYSQIELRVLAHFSGDAELIKAFAEGIDIHAAVAAQVFGVDHAAVTSDMRRVAKAVNFGVIYGQSPFGLASALGIPKEEAATFIDGYFTRYAGVTRFIDQTLDDVLASGHATTLLGRRRPIEGIRPDHNRSLNMPERTAVNTVIQGSAADLIKRAMLAVRRRMREENHPARMLLQIHDELVFESPVHATDSLVKLVRHEMQHAMTLTVPLVVDVSVGPNWLETTSVKSS